MNKRIFLFSIVVIVISVFVLSFNSVSGGVTLSTPPECWDLESISYTGEVTSEQLQTIQRVSIYSIHDDDSVTPDHTLTGLPYFSSFSWTGSSDVEWLTFEGNYSSLVVDPVTHSVTFYDVFDWIHIVYRTYSFVQRTPDEIYFCVIGQNGAAYWPTQAKILYPGNYQLDLAIPSDYNIPAPGEISWDFGTTTEFQIEGYFSGLGPIRPQLDWPVDYEGRSTGNSSIGFTNAFRLRTISQFDHELPNYSDNDYFLSFTGVPQDNPEGVNECNHGVSCYDGHDGYDIDDRCPAPATCNSPSAVYPAADGAIVYAGWPEEDDPNYEYLLGCQIVIDHGDQWRTIYGHLEDENEDGDCEGILVESGEVTRLTHIGIIGASGNAIGTHLHFSVTFNGIVVDPSGWEGNPDNDPWANDEDGTISYPMWLYSIRTTQAVNPNIGGSLISPTYDVIASIPSDYYFNQLMFNLSAAPVSGMTDGLLNTGHSFSLTAADSNGIFVNQLNTNITLQVSFVLSDTQGIDLATLGLYSWDQTINEWIDIPTTIDWQNLTATAQVDHLSIFALMGKTNNVIYLPILRR